MWRQTLAPAKVGRDQLNVSTTDVQGTLTIARGYVVDAALAVLMLHDGSYCEGDGAVLGDPGVQS